MNANNNPRLRAALRIAFAGLILLRANGAPAADIHRLASPDGRIVVLIEMPAPNSTARPRWSAAFHGKPVLAGCELGLQTSNAGEMMAGARVRRERSRSISRLVPVLFGKSDRAYDCFRETRFSLETLGRRRLDVVFRAYDDAVALRYELPKDDDAGSVTVTDETTSFVMAGEPEACPAPMKRTASRPCAAVRPATAATRNPWPLSRRPSAQPTLPGPIIATVKGRCMVRGSPRKRKADY